VGLQSRSLIFNPELCTGCAICELICSFTRFKVFNPRLSLVRIEYNYEVGKVERATFCTQCGECSRVCPTGALYIANGVTLLDYSKCIFCLACAGTCPTGALKVIDGRPVKCDLCGGNPLCVRYCVRGALRVS